MQGFAAFVFAVILAAVVAFSVDSDKTQEGITQIGKLFTEADLKLPDLSRF